MLYTCPCPSDEEGPCTAGKMDAAEEQMLE